MQCTMPCNLCVQCGAHCRTAIHASACLLPKHQLLTHYKASRWNLSYKLTFSRCSFKLWVVELDFQCTICLTRRKVAYHYLCAILCRLCQLDLLAQLRILGVDLRILREYLSLSRWKHDRLNILPCMINLNQNKCSSLHEKYMWRHIVKCHVRTKRCGKKHKVGTYPGQKYGIKLFGDVY